MFYIPRRQILCEVSNYHVFSFSLPQTLAAPGKYRGNNGQLNLFISVHQVFVQGSRDTFMNKTKFLWTKTISDSNNCYTWEQSRGSWGHLSEENSWNKPDQDAVPYRIRNSGNKGLGEINFDGLKVRARWQEWLKQIGEWSCQSRFNPLLLGLAGHSKKSGFYWGWKQSDSFEQYYDLP